MPTIKVNADADTVGTAVAAGAVGFGAAGLLAPKLVVRTYGLPDTGPFRFLTRLWGTRTAALGALMLLDGTPRGRRNLVLVAAAMNAVDAGVALSAGPDVSTRTKVMAAATSGTFALAAGALAAGIL